MATTAKKSNPKSARKEKPITADPRKIQASEMLIAGLVLAFVALVRIRLLSFPFERDEGEYAYFGQLILSGIAPFDTAYNLKFPGTYACYALIMGLFGQSMEAIRVGLLLFNLGTLVFIFLITRKLFNSFTALAAIAISGTLLLSPSVHGQAAHATHFVTFFMTAGVWFLIRAFETKTLIQFALAGLMMGLSVVMKQSGVVFAFFGALLIVVHHIRFDRANVRKVVVDLMTFGLGAAVPIIFLFAVMYASGVFEKFWFWTVVYPGTYSSRVPLSDAWEWFSNSVSVMIEAFPLLWLVALLGIPALVFYNGNKWSKIFIGLLLVFSFLHAVPGFYFRRQYFIPMLPVLGILAGIFFDFINQKLGTQSRQVRYLTGGLFAIVFLSQLIAEKDYLFKADVATLCDESYTGNLFNESIPVAKYLETNTGADEKVLVFGSEPQIYFYAKRKAATSYIYMYDLAFEQKYVQEMQNDFKKQVEAEKPNYIVFCSSPSSWMSVKTVTGPLFAWFNNYMATHKYLPVGFADNRFPDEAVYAWDDDARNFRPMSDRHMVVFKKSE